MSALGFRAQVKAMTREDAEAVTSSITSVLRGGALTVAPLIVEAYRGRAWQSLGYATWDDYCRAEFTGPRMLRIPDDMMTSILAKLTTEGLSVRGRASALGISVGKAHRLSPKMGEGAQVISLDGKRRNATQKLAASMSSHPAGKALPDKEPAVDYGKLPMHEQAALMARECDQGVTVHELCAMTGWPQGTASCALSRAAKRGLVIHTGTNRDGAGIYR
jgi:hypothetical protein